MVESNRALVVQTHDKLRFSSLHSDYVIASVSYSDAKVEMRIFAAEQDMNIVEPATHVALLSPDGSAIAEARHVIVVRPTGSAKWSPVTADFRIPARPHIWFVLNEEEAKLFHTAVNVEHASRPSLPGGVH